MDKTKLENQILHWHQQECCHDADMDRIMCLSTIGLYQVSIKAEEDSRINNIISLAGVSDFKVRFSSGQHLKQWKQEGVMFVENGRTKQQMPHYFQFFEDFIKNENRLTIKRAV